MTELKWFENLPKRFHTPVYPVYKHLPCAAAAHAFTGAIMASMGRLVGVSFAVRFHI